MNTGSKQGGGLDRPRSRRAHLQVLDAAIELFAERGIDGTSIDSIAASSKVSKATIYKHWRDKEALALEALGRLHGLDRPQPSFHSGDLRKDMLDFLNHKPPEELSGLRDRLMPHLIAYAARNPAFGTIWRSHVLGPARTNAFELMERGIKQGYFAADLDKNLGSALLIGPMMYNHVFHKAAPTPENLSEGVVQAFWRAFAIRKSAKTVSPLRRTGRKTRH